jgi:hypothetical protein
MKLIYRGQSFSVNARQISDYKKPYAINWRYQVPSEKYQENNLPKMIYQYPKAINWRFD